MRVTALQINFNECLLKTKLRLMEKRFDLEYAPCWRGGLDLANCSRRRRPSFPRQWSLNLREKGWDDGSLWGGGSWTQFASTKCTVKKI